MRRRPQLRLPLDATLGLLLALNMAALGAALGGYGPRLLEALALHGPLELAAFALAGGAYLAARARPAHHRPPWRAAAAVAVALLAGRRLVETYVRLGADR